MSAPRPSLIRLHWPLIGLILIAASAVLWPVPGGWLSRLALGWDVGVGLFLLEAFLKLIRRNSAAKIREMAAAFDSAGAFVLPLALVAAAASVGVVVGEAVLSADADKGGPAILALITVSLSWFFVHVIFAFHYAHAFYAPASAPGTPGKDGGGRGKGKDRGGLVFPGGEDPDYWDFLHFSLIIGVASQTADIQISDKGLRRISTVHSVTAFLFNTVVVALTVNMAVSLLGA